MTFGIALACIIATEGELRSPMSQILNFYSFEVTSVERHPVDVGQPMHMVMLTSKSADSRFAGVTVNLNRTPRSDPYHAYDDFKGRPGSKVSARWQKDWARPHETASGWPLGLDLYFVGGAGSLRVMATGKTASVVVHVRSRGQSVNRNIQWATDAENRRGALAEDLARWALAQLTGDKMETAGEISFNGKSVGRFRAQGDARHFDAHAWAVAMGYSQKLNRFAGRLSIQTPKGALLLILGSSKAKLGNEWITLPDVLAARDERFLVPEVVVQRVGN